ncbi:MAG: TIGR02281 family clan AA aspartic protease [Rhodocyclaceae bacterium]|nr:TIGR02281 family clan AA aspartic protease [Rhodocyclaceae bacterium]MDZ4215621.1 TIGR02281 family clan AA aspartic protease [Rhodocyclaceae bacterium]
MMHCSAALLAVLSLPAQAADIALVGLLPGKALVVIDGGKRQTLAVGAKTVEGIKLLSIESGAALFEVDGKSRRIQIGQSVVSSGSSEKPVLTLMADVRGHYTIQGSINGTSMNFLVDTGATYIALGAADARRAGIDPHKGTPGITQTANGQARVWKVKLNSVKIGGIALSNIDATVHEQDMPVVLLGMSFLNRMDIRRDGQSMTLTQRY